MSTGAESPLEQYLGDWLDEHALGIKPATLSTYRHLVTHYVNAHLGRMRLQAVRPTTLSGLYRDLLVHGGKEGRPLSRGPLTTFTPSCARPSTTRFVRSSYS